MPKSYDTSWTTIRRSSATGDAAATPKHAQHLQQHEHRPTLANAPAARLYSLWSAVAVKPQGRNALRLEYIVQPSAVHIQC